MPEGGSSPPGGARRLPSPGSLYLTPVDVTDDWTDPDNAVLDILDLEAFEFTPEHDVYIYLWEGEFDPDDLGSLKISALGVATWEDTDGGSGDFASAPVSEMAYILSIQVIAA